MVGLIPLFAVTTIEPGAARAAAGVQAAGMEWFLEHRPHLARLVSRWQEPGMGERRLLAICRGHRMKRVLQAHARREPSSCRPTACARSRATTPTTPTSSTPTACATRVDYQPAESNSGLFGGNSNWRGPIWFPVNYLLIESLQKFHHYYGDDFKVECPTGSGQYLTLHEIADELSRRLIAHLPARRRTDGRRACLRRAGALPARPALARLRPVLRVLPRRQRRGPRRQPPDRLDGRWSPS